MPIHVAELELAIHGQKGSAEQSKLRVRAMMITLHATLRLLPLIFIKHLSVLNGRGGGGGGGGGTGLVMQSFTSEP